jgi:dTMP kinase
LDLAPEVGFARVRERGEAENRFEAEDLEFHRELRAAYREVVEREPERCVLIDASANPDVVAVRIWMAVQERLLRPLREGQAPRAAG